MLSDFFEEPLVMNIFDFHKTILNTSTDYLKKLSAFNPLTIHKKGTKAKAIFALTLGMYFLGHYLGGFQARRKGYAGTANGRHPSVCSRNHLHWVFYL
jgi:hypothetical protein